MLDYLASLCLMRVAIINHLFFFFFNIRIIPCLPRT